MRLIASLPSDGGRSRRWLLAGALVVLVAATLAIGLVATPVAGHAYLSETDPGNGEQVESLPDEVTLEFSGDGVVNADITIEGPDGDTVSSEPEIDPDDSQVVHVPVDDAADDADDGDAADEDGMYTVEWEVLAEDGHTTSGSFFFAVGDEPLDRDAVLEAHEDEGEADESIPPIEAGAKALLLVGVVGLLGIPTTASFVVSPVFARRRERGGTSPHRSSESQPTTVERRIGRLLVGAAVLALVGALVLGLARATALGPLAPETLLEFADTPLGRAWVVQAVLAAGIVGVVGATARGLLGRRVGYAGTAIGGLAVAGTIAWTSHSATAIDRVNGMVVDFAHVLGAGLWIGGLAVLALVVVPAVRAADSDDRPALLARTIERFSILALAGVTLVVATGLILASWHVPTADGLLETTYGLVLVAKLVLAAVALGLAGFTRFVLLGRLEVTSATDPADTHQPASTDGGTPQRASPKTVARVATAVRLELAVLVVVLLLSGVLTSAPTAAVAGMDDELSESTIEYEYDDVVLEVSALPVAEDSGEETLTLEADEPIVFDVAFLDKDEPLESDQPVRLLASGADGTEREVELEATDDGSYATVQPFAEEGSWELRITGAPDGAYVSEWIDAVVVPADDHDHADHDHDHDEQDHADHDHDETDHADHDHDETDHDDHAAHTDEDESTPFQTLLQFGAVVTIVAGVVAVTVESLRVRGGEER